MSPADVPQMWPQGGGSGWGGGIASAQQRLCSRALRSREPPPPPPPPIPAVSRLFEVEPTRRKEAGIDWRRALGEECVTLFLPFFPPSLTAPVFSLLLLFTLSRRLLSTSHTSGCEASPASYPGCNMAAHSGETRPAESAKRRRRRSLSLVLATVRDPAGNSSQTNLSVQPRAEKTSGTQKTECEEPDFHPWKHF